MVLFLSYWFRSDEGVAQSLLAGTIGSRSDLACFCYRLPIRLSWFWATLTGTNIFQSLVAAGILEIKGRWAAWRSASSHRFGLDSCRCLTSSISASKVLVHHRVGPPFLDPSSERCGADRVACAPGAASPSSSASDQRSFCLLRPLRRRVAGAERTGGSLSAKSQPRSPPRVTLSSHHTDIQTFSQGHHGEPRAARRSGQGQDAQPSGAELVRLQVVPRGLRQLAALHHGTHFLHPFRASLVCRLPPDGIPRHDG